MKTKNTFVRIFSVKNCITLATFLAIITIFYFFIGFSGFGRGAIVAIPKNVDIYGKVHRIYGPFYIKHSDFDYYDYVGNLSGNFIDEYNLDFKKHGYKAKLEVEMYYGIGDSKNFVETFRRSHKEMKELYQKDMEDFISTKLSSTQDVHKIGSELGIYMKNKYEKMTNSYINYDIIYFKLTKLN
ncbi:MAG: hypothetical protein ACK5N8_05910 [Alphaproteobacteria bacterium]